MNLLQVNKNWEVRQKNCVFHNTSNEKLLYQHSSYHNYTLTLIWLLVIRMNFAWKMHGRMNPKKRLCLNSKRHDVKLHRCVDKKTSPKITIDDHCIILI
jgi:hypothetical protein